MFEQNLLKALAKEYRLRCEPMGLEYHPNGPNPCNEIPLYPLESLYRWSHDHFSVTVRISGDELLIVDRFPLFGVALLHNRFSLVEPDSLDKLRSTIENLKEQVANYAPKRRTSQSLSRLRPPLIP